MRLLVVVVVVVVGLSRSNSSGKFQGYVVAL